MVVGFVFLFYLAYIVLLILDWFIGIFPHSFLGPGQLWQDWIQSDVLDPLCQKKPHKKSPAHYRRRFI